jgi:hypothetical protein
VSDCVNAEVRDALPDLLHGRLSELDTATMKAHVESCAGCRAELELMREIMREARSAARITPPIDAAKIAAAIGPYPAPGVVPSGTRRTTVFGNGAMLRIAMVAAVVAVGGWLLSSGIDDEPGAVTQTAATPSSVTSVTSESNSASSSTGSSPAAPARAATSAPRETQVASLSLVGSTAELTDADLEKLVAELDGMESLPSAEPQSLPITDEDFDTGDDNTNP